MEPALDPDLPIVDPHHHLWDNAPGGAFRPYPIEVFAAERSASGHNIQASVFVDCAYGYLADGPPELRPIGETRTVEAKARQAEARGERGLAAGIVSSANMLLGAEIEPVLQAHLSESPDRFRGIRQITPWHPGTTFFGSEGVKELLRTDAFAEALKVLARLGLTFDAYVYFTQLSDVAYLARRVPEATIVLDHTGAPGSAPLPADQAENLWRSGLAEVARCPNVTLKVGGLLMHHQGGDVSGSEAAAKAMRDHVLTAIDLFGPQRCMFESNFPVDGTMISYGNLWNAFKRIVADFGSDERQALFAGVAARTYRLHDLTARPQTL